VSSHNKVDLVSEWTGFLCCNFVELLVSNAKFFCVCLNQNLVFLL